ncbi:MAG TPA: sigma-70 family RNA polymerase sigma factor [Myxococcaceae bacterium]|nr:sigma-70 family RNA polymerase sigma factor [Myxococcaceae bacterium]
MSPGTLQSLPPGEQELQLIQRLRARDRSAQTELVRRYQGRLLRQAFKLLKDWALAEDMVQETWLVVLASANRFEGRSTLLSWLTGIVINRARDYRRKQSRVLKLSSMGEKPESSEVQSGTDSYCSTGRLEPVTEPTAEREVLEREQARALRAAVRELPETQRSVVLLQLRGYDPAETREALHITDLARRVRLSRARSRLRADLVRYAA